MPSATDRKLCRSIRRSLFLLHFRVIPLLSFHAMSSARGDVSRATSSREIGMLSSTMNNSFCRRRTDTKSEVRPVDLSNDVAQHSIKRPQNQFIFLVDPPMISFLLLDVVFSLWRFETYEHRWSTMTAVTIPSVEIISRQIRHAHRLISSICIERVVKIEL